MNEPSADSVRPVLDYAPAPKRTGRKIVRSLLLIAMVLTTGAIGACVAYLLQPVTYTAVGFLSINATFSPLGEDVQKLEQDKHAQALALAKIARDLHIDARIQPVPEQKLIKVEVSDSNASEAAGFVNNLMDADKLAAAPGTVRIAHRASSLVGGHRQPLIPVTGLFAGLLVGIVGLLAFRRNSKAVSGPKVASPL